MAYSVLMPRKIVYGAGALERAAVHISAMGTRALVVTDNMMVNLGNAGKLEEILASMGVGASVYAGVNAEPTDVVVRGGAAQYIENGCDFMVALGGGSPIDTMKAIALMVSSNRDIDSFLGEAYEGATCSMVAIPTTAGTGSEATQFTIITDTERDIKMLLRGESLIPDLAVIDPQFTLTAPPHVTSATGIDALCHAVEAYTSRKAQPIADTFALSATKRIFENLRTCYNEPGNIDARTQMAIASLEAGIAFNNSSVTVVHGMSRPIGALFHIPHGLSNAMLLWTCLAYIADEARGRFASLARYCEISSAKDDETASREFVQAIGELLRDLNIESLHAYGVDAEDYRAVIPKMAADALASGSPANTIKELDTDDIVALYERAYER